MTTLTPTLMFGAMTIAMCSACAAISAFWAASKPVVPTTAATPSSRQRARWASVPCGRVKSISTSLAASAARASAPTTTPLGRPRKAVASLPMLALPGTSNAAARTRSALAATASISVWPMRPDAPAMATRRRGAARRSS